MIFICHSSDDKPFARELVAKLKEDRNEVWIDELEIKVGDSLFDKIGDGLQRMDFLIVVMTPKAVASKWCNEELKAALNRQLEERRTVVLPVLLKDCDIPIFLKEKVYADFRTDFEAGYESLSSAIATVVDLSAGTSKTDKFKTDFAWDYGFDDVTWRASIDSVSFSTDQDFSVLCKVQIAGDPLISKRMKQYEAADLLGFGSAISLGMLAEALDNNKNNVTLTKGEKASQKLAVGKQEGPA